MQRFAFEHEGVEREYFVHVPPEAKEPLPVVVGLHCGVPAGYQFSGGAGVESCIPDHGLEFLW
jgi:poly(3-hydroxybutyrate) depolymerase